VGGPALATWLGRMTKRRWQGVLLGALATAIVQSSSAITSLAVALVDAGSISFKSSLGILLGANVGTTSTAWLVSLKLTSIGPFFIVLGTLLSALPTRWKILGKTAFYFGFIFFSLELVSDALKPLQELPLIRAMLTEARSPLTGVAAGLVITAIVQSSSITTGLAILLVQQGMLAATAAIPIVIGANIGHDVDRIIGELEHEKNRAANGDCQPGVQHHGSSLVSALSESVFSSFGRAFESTGYGRRLGTPHLQSRHDNPSAPSLENIRSSDP
jgi:phosphate:Na+ symporter